MIYQDLSLFPNLTVAENIATGRHRRIAGLVNWTAIRETATAAMKRIDASLDLDETVSQLSIANRQLVAICRAIAADARGGAADRLQRVPPELDGLRLHGWRRCCRAA